jgi:ATP-dependent DNA helicase RecQ
MESPLDILQRYWGHEQFRPLQEDIIRSVLEGNDTLALLPTGGGKSICFQVPALCINKLCIVVSPLIALMNDQVEHLEAKGIAAAAITSAMQPDEIGIVLENCSKGQYAFLYVSPERIENEQFRQTIANIEIGLIAIDEAHCIAQWGFDFRPAYLHIASLRAILGKEIPFIALTATATPEVCTVIAEKLEMQKHRFFSKSFFRPEIIYVVRNTEDKLRQLTRILDKVKGTSIVYVRNRKRTREISEWLNLQGISSSSYHAGLDHATRNLRQQQWIENKIRVMVCTNAFGMGIDKPDVRSVVHLDIPESPEAYFQEAGRGGRDGKKAYAVLLADNADAEGARERYKNNYPGFDAVKAVYSMLGNYLQIPVGSAEGQIFTFDPAEFANRYRLNPVQVVQALKFIEQEGLIAFNALPDHRARIHIPISKEKIYEFEVMHPEFEALIKTLLRSYGGVLSDLVYFREAELAERMQMEPTTVKQKLHYLNKLGVVQYTPAASKPELFFTSGRQHPDRISLSQKNYRKMAETAYARFSTMIDYATQHTRCRSLVLLDYFEEKNIEPCGKCDVCLGDDTKRTENLVLKALASEAMSYEILLKLPVNPGSLAEVLRRFMDEGKIGIDLEMRYSLKGK